MQSTQERTGTLNRLLRGEMAAVETYDQALETVGDEPGAAELRRIESEHRQATEVLRQLILARGGQPAASSGAWGAWAQAVEGTAKLFGSAVALKALKEGEEHGVKDYQEALQDPNLDTECRSTIQSTLLPQTSAHVPVLDRLIQTL